MRAHLRAQLRMLGPEQRSEESTRLCDQVRQFVVWRDARRVLLFAPLPDEPDVWPLALEAVKAGKEVGLPSYDPVRNRYGARQVRDPGLDLVAGEFGVREPRHDCPEVALATLDLVLVPGLGFSTEGGRLGRGGGFYDRLLAATDAVRVGVGLDEQIVPWLPLEPHDAQLHFVVTPSGIHTVARSRSGF